MELSLSLETSTALDPQPLTPSPRRKLLTPIPDAPGEFLFIIDNSSLEVFTTCPRSAFYKLVLGREAHARNAALTFGGALHEGLEKFLFWQATGATPEEVGAATQDQAILSFFTQNPAPPDEYRTVQNCLAVLAAYRQRAAMPDYQWEIKSDDSGPIIERAFELPLGVVEIDAYVNMPWLDEDQHTAMSFKGETNREGKVYVRRIHVAWSGRIDAVTHSNGRVRVTDHKTTSIAGDSFVQDFQISNQVLGYVWAGRQLWPDLDISAFCLNAVHFKKPTGSGPITSPGPRGGPAALNFFRAYFDYSPERVESWATNCLSIISDFLHCVVRDYYPLHTKWCFGKYGMCPYHPVCTVDSEQVRLNLVQSDLYRPVTWNPVAGR